jgi:hypothetical protein
LYLAATWPARCRRRAGSARSNDLRWRFPELTRGRTIGRQAFWLPSRQSDAKALTDAAA